MERVCVVCAVGFEPTAIRLKVECSTTELRAHDVVIIAHRERQAQGEIAEVGA